MSNCQRFFQIPSLRSAASNRRQMAGPNFRLRRSKREHRTLLKAFLHLSDFFGGHLQCRWGFQVPKKIRNGRDKKGAQFCVRCKCLIICVAIVQAACLWQVPDAGSFQYLSCLETVLCESWLGEQKKIRKQA